jgi:mRNA interferase RelE/StbE
LAYKITFIKSVYKDLKNISKADVSRIMSKLESELSEKADTFPELQGDFAGLRKYRVGNYRIIYAIIHDTVLIVRIRHRKDVYKN